MSDASRDPTIMEKAPMTAEAVPAISPIGTMARELQMGTMITCSAFRPVSSAHQSQNVGAPPASSEAAASTAATAM